MTKLALSTKTSTKAASHDFEKLTYPNAAIPSAPVHAARLNGLLKSLANAEGAVAESIKARKVLIEGLERLLATNKIALEAEEHQFAELAERRETIDNKKHEVEDSIMRGFSTTSPAVGTPTNTFDSSTTPTDPVPEPERPDMEALTPPAFEAISPQSPLSYEDRSQVLLPTQVPAAGSDLLASLAGSYGTNRVTSNGSNSAKKRKLDTDEFGDFGGDAMDDLDPDVAAMLRGDDA